jgi:beta-glucanase (GH16 family)
VDVGSFRTRTISLALLATSGCSPIAASSADAGWMEGAAFAQSSSPKANTGQPPGGAFIVDFTKGYDERTHTLADWYMDTGWLRAEFSPRNIRFDPAGMTLAVARHEGGRTDYLSSEFQRQGFYGYGRYEVVMRAAKMPGVVSSFFTHTDNYFGDDHSEIDFEFIGDRTREVHLSYHWKGNSTAVDYKVWFDTTEGLHLYAFEWLPDSLTWYIDGVQARRVEAATANPRIPSDSSRVLANIWAANQSIVEWVGKPQGAGASAYYRCMSHVPAGRSGPQCSDRFTPPPRPAAD